MEAPAIARPLDDAVVDFIAGEKFVRNDVVPCPICNRYQPSRPIKAQFGMTAMVAVCDPCRLAYQSPRPSPEATLAYMNWRWASADQYVADKGAQLKRGLEQIGFVQRYRNPPASILDFGAGAGSFVRVALDAGWDAHGVERSDTARAKAKAIYGVDLHAELGERLYDVVTLWDVVEHLRTPEKMLTQLYGVLKPGGLIFIETGNWECWRRLVNGDKWHLYLFDHHFYFSPSSLKHILSNAGFVDYEHADIVRSAPPGLAGIMKMPRYNVMCWAAWARAKLNWPKHGDMDMLIAKARRPA